MRPVTSGTPFSKPFLRSSLGSPASPSPWVAVEVDYEPRRVPLRLLCRQLRNCRDVLPSTEFNELAADLPMERQTYGEAARAMHDYIEARSR